MDAPGEELNEFFKAIGEKTKLVVYLKDAEGRYLYVNKEYEAVSTVPREHILGKRDHDLFPRDVADLFRAQDAEVTRARKPATFEETIPLPGGTRSFITEKVPLFDKDGKVCAVGGFCTEITAQTGRGEEKYRQLFENCPDAIALADAETKRILDINPAALRLYGASREEVLARTIADFSAEPEATQAALSEVAAGGPRYISQRLHRRLDGTPIPVEVSAAGAVLDGRRVIIGFIRDVSERRRTEDELSKVRDLNRITLDSMQDVFYLIGKDLRFLSWNKALNEVSGYSDPEVGRMTATDFIAASDVPGVVAAIAQVWLKGTASVEATVVTKRGARIPYEFTGAVVRDASGKVIGLSGIGRNLSERRRMEESLRTLQKLESLGTLAGGIAHDFNNMLTGIMGNIYLLDEDLQGDPAKLEVLREAESACQTAKALARQLLTFASGGTPVVKTEELAPIVRQAAVFSVRGSKVECVFQDAPSPLYARVDRDQLFQVVQNLVLNAVQAMPHGGTVTVALAPAKLDGIRSARLTVSDEGTGIPSEHLSKVFDPYFTTKETGRGLGLAVCHSIVTKHGGRIEVASRPGSGTTFTVLLSAGEGPAAAPAQSPTAAPPISSGRFLVMDDDAIVAKTLERILSRMGGAVELAADGESALEAWKKAHETGTPFAALFADLTIPGGMGGKELARRLKALDPRVKVIASSGYSDDPVMSRHEEHGFVGVLLKPYRPDEVAAVLALALKTP